MTRHFDRYIAVDWTGAKGKTYGGIAVAICGQGDTAPKLLKPKAGGWTRSLFVDWISTLPASSGRIMIGIDCAFSLPHEMASQVLGGDYSAFELWRHIDETCADHNDFYGGYFAQHTDITHLYWHSGSRPSDFVESHRATEKACEKMRLGRPESPLKLIGPKQVGKASLAGMRVLNALKKRLEGEFAVWPFEPVDGSRIVCAEIYPRLFLTMAEQGSAKASGAEINLRLAALGSAPAENPGSLTGHDTDALIAAAGLRHIADDPAMWSPPGLDALAIRAEGWIFGVA
jgi:hypothetical protein